MLYAQFYQRSAVNPADIIEACGDRSVVIIDARLRPATIGRIAANECRRRGYVAWRIFVGDTFTRSSPHPHSQLTHIHSGKPDNTAMSATHGA